MAILVTGGAGYIGSHTCVELLNAGYDVVVADNLYNSSKKAVDRVEQITGKKLKFYEVDLLDQPKVKEIFDKVRVEYADRPFILEKFNPKGEFKTITFREFSDDVIALGTALTNKYNLKNERIVIIGENTYHWYVSYMAMVCGTGIAVPVDKELPVNEIENVINRSKATAVIYSTKKKEVIKKV